LVINNYETTVRLLSGALMIVTVRRRAGAQHRSISNADPLACLIVRVVYVFNTPLQTGNQNVVIVPLGNFLVVLVRLVV